MESNVEHVATHNKICLVSDWKIYLDDFSLNKISQAFESTSVGVVYSDFNVATSNFDKNPERICPPMWSMERFLAVDYLGPLIAMRSSLLEINEQHEVSRTKSILNAHDQGLEITLIQNPLYEVVQSEFQSTWESRADVIGKYFESINRASKITSTKTSWLDISNALLAPDRISVIIPTRGGKANWWGRPLIFDCIDTLMQQKIGNHQIEVIVVFDSDTDQSYLDQLRTKDIPGFSFTLVGYDPPFNFSRKCNLGASHATGEVLLFLNDDTLWRNDDALLELAGSAMLPNVGAVGAKLFFKNGRIQHAGYILRNGFVGHAYFKDVDGFGPFGDLVATHEVVGVTGACLAQKRTVWETVGQWDEEFPGAYNDIDYCFKIRESGFTILQVNSARLIHFESITRDPIVKPFETERILQRWKHRFTAEPFFRMQVRTAEVQFISGGLLGEYYRYAISTYRHKGIAGLVGLVSNFSSKLFK